MTNLQTLSYIAFIDSLLRRQRIPQSHAEQELLDVFDAVRDFLEKTTFVLETNLDLTTRKMMNKSFDISFHRKYKNLHEIFKFVRDYYIQISPDICNIYVNSVSSVMELVELYSEKSQMLQRYEGHTYQVRPPEIGYLEETENLEVVNWLIIWLFYLM